MDGWFERVDGGSWGRGGFGIHDDMFLGSGEGAKLIHKSNTTSLGSYIYSFLKAVLDFPCLLQ